MRLWYPTALGGARGHDRAVVAPSLIPKRAGDRVKTDRRDVQPAQARLHRAGELTAVWVPDPGTRRMRDLVRARLDAVHALRRARQQLSGFLLRHGCHCGRPAWTKLHRRWLAGLKFEQAVHHLVLGRTTCKGFRPCGAARSADRADRGDAAGLDIGAGRGGIADDARRGAGQCRHLDRRTGRPLALRQSAPADGLSRAGAVRAFERRQRPARRDHQDRQHAQRAEACRSRPRGATDSARSAASCCCVRRTSRDRSATSPGRGRFASAPAIASSPAAASRPMSSPSRSPASWRFRSGAIRAAGDGGRLIGQTA